MNTFFLFSEWCSLSQLLRSSSLILTAVGRVGFSLCCELVYTLQFCLAPSPLLCHELFQGKGPAFPTSESRGSSTDSVLPKLESGNVHLCCLKLCRELYLRAFLHLIWFPSSSYRLAGNICNVLLIGALRSRKKKKQTKKTVK